MTIEDQLNAISSEMYDKDKTYSIIGSAMQVHQTLGSGFLEAVYSDAMELELKKRNVPYEREKAIKILYNKIILPHQYVADFVCYDSIIVELKAVEQLTKIHEAQLLNYLKATNLRIGLLINFGEMSLKFKRMVY